MALSPSDFVIIRFATKKYGFMREADCSLVPWLEHRKIKYTSVGTRVYFELPEDLQKYTKITPELAKNLGIYSREIRRRLLAIQFTRAYRYRDKLDDDELRVLGLSEIQI